MKVISDFFEKYKITKHTIVVIYAALFTLFQTNTNFNAYALTIYAMFPHWASALVVGLIVPLLTFYHVGLSATGAADTAATTATPATTAAAALKTGALVMLIGLVTLGMAGCPSVSITTAVQDIVAYEPTAAALAQEASSLVTQFDPALQAQATTATNLIITNLANIKTVGNTYLSSPSPTSWASIVNLVNSIVADADSQLLIAARITNPDSQKKATAILGALDLAVHVIDSYVQKVQPPAVVKATAAVRTTKLQSVSAFWPGDKMTPAVRSDLKYAQASGF
jgi:hypothetical protein